ncbi:MAG: transporter substrate-binding domain-containing protein [Rhodospirillaceae bacterium]|jgi:octopine/nopaline transport system substrate-binding protein|nr:transporter substrate-binding domain-containing protein [Rhodospirillaceae bacterium]MBT5895125.1 transporter substrate-binding domain-containing protein [Rhodospirillaceae bacterium]MBT7757030.1 transporter substrate-binding domain-containing protein [Rhodospirillaceae bacterium]
MKKLLTLAAIAAMAFAGAAQAADYKKIKIATEGAYAPWNYKDSSGKLIGFELDLAADLCKRMGIECTVVEQAWDGIIPSLQAGKYDAIVAGMSITDKRKKVITFSRSYAQTPASFVVGKSSKSAGFKTGVDRIDLTTVEAGEKAAIADMVKEFGGKTIGVQTATTHENFLREHLGKNITIRTYDTQENLDLDLQAGRVDAALASMSYWVPLLKTDKGKDMVAVGPGMVGGPFGHGVGAGIRKKDQALADMFSKAIQSAIDDGSVSKLAIKWFGFDASAK